MKEELSALGDAYCKFREWIGGEREASFGETGGKRDSLAGSCDFEACMRWGYTRLLPRTESWNLSEIVERRG